MSTDNTESVWWNGSPVGHISFRSHSCVTPTHAQNVDGWVGWMPDGEHCAPTDSREAAESWVRDRYQELWGGKPGAES